MVPPPPARLPPAAGLADVEVFDRSTGEALSVHEKDGRHYVVGQPGREYAIRITNRSAGRILAVTSVDGVNVVSGDTASPEQSGYVIDSAGSVEIAGWRKSFSRTAAFFFTEHSNSYAVRTGRPFDVGVIGSRCSAEQARRARISRIGRPGRANGPTSSAEIVPHRKAQRRKPRSQPAAKAQSSDRWREIARPRHARWRTWHRARSPQVSHVRQ